MKSLYVTSVERYSGKTATCLALGKRFQAAGLKVGYLKPLSLQPWRIGDHIADEDAAFVIEALDLHAYPWDLSTVVVTSGFLKRCLQGEGVGDLMGKVVQAHQKLATSKDIILLEGGGSLREGYLVGLPTPEVSKALESNALAIVKYRDDVRVVDDALTASARLGDSLLGIIINRVPSIAQDYVTNLVIPFLEGKGIPVLGSLPEVPLLASITISELIEVLDAEVLTTGYDPQSQVETLTVGAMTADAALSRFRKYKNKAVITGGDRTDIQLAALETSTACLILTGHLRPSPLIIKQAEEFGVPILLVRPNTMETIEQIEGVFGKTRMGQSAKLDQFQRLLNEHVDLERIDQFLGLK